MGTYVLQILFVRICNVDRDLRAPRLGLKTTSCLSRPLSMHSLTVDQYPLLNFPLLRWQIASSIVVPTGYRETAVLYL